MMISRCFPRFAHFYPVTHRILSSKFQAPQPAPPHGRKWLQVEASARAPLDHEKSQPEVCILQPVRDTARSHAMGLRAPYFLAAALVALLESGVNCSAMFAVSLYDCLDYVAEK
jgi:hypothetical protein